MSIFYHSTRSADRLVTSKQAILRGIAPDGGLYVSDALLDARVDLAKVCGQGYRETALDVLSVLLSDFSAAELARVAVAGDVKRMTSVPGVGKKLAGRLVLELQGAFSGDVELRGLLGVTTPDDAAAPAPAPAAPLEEATAALLSMGFTPEEAALALEGCEGAASVEDALSHALRRLGGGR